MPNCCLWLKKNLIIHLIGVIYSISTIKHGDHIHGDYIRYTYIHTYRYTCSVCGGIKYVTEFNFRKSSYNMYIHVDRISWGYLWVLQSYSSHRDAYNVPRGLCTRCTLPLCSDVESSELISFQKCKKPYIFELALVSCCQFCNYFTQGFMLLLSF